MTPKILLIEPPFTVEEYNNYRGNAIAAWTPSLWALCLATFLKKNISEIRIEILDGQIISFNLMADRISWLKPDIVGISPNLNTYEKALKLARIAKKGGAKVIFGGAHASGLAREIIKNRGLASPDYCIDAVVKGDGERAFYKFVTNTPFNEIKNLVYQDADGQIKENEIEFLNVDTLPMIDFGFVHFPDYFKNNRERYPQFNWEKKARIYTQKGCIWRKTNKKGCIFCCLCGGGLRLRNPKIICREIDVLIRNHKINTINITGDMTFEDKRWFEEFYREVKKIKYPLPAFSATLRIGALDDLTAKRMREINLNHAYLGIESGSGKSLRALNTGTTPELIGKTVKLLVKYGFRMSFYFILGAPGETRQTLKETIELAKKFSFAKRTKYLFVSTLVPMPGSPAWDLFLSRCGDKYAYSDAIDFKRVNVDWLKYFCDVGFEEIISAKNTIKALSPNN